MTSLEILARLRRLGLDAVTTADTAAAIGLSVPAASHALRRLAAVGLVTPIRKGLWALPDRVDPLSLADYVTAPYPSYVSLQTALYQHGMIEQIPEMTYLVSLARSSRIDTGVGTYSVHHVQPELFGGFTVDRDSGIKMATPEKALVDFLYLSPTRTRLFASLPELTLPSGFRMREVRDWLNRIATSRLRTIATERLNSILASSDRTRVSDAHRR
jgi:predicted transcriptional regulator of viral defense system